MGSTTAVPSWPRITAEFEDDGTVRVDVPNRTVWFAPRPDVPARDQALAWLVGYAEQLQRGVRVATNEAGVVLLVHTDGTFGDERHPHTTHRVPPTIPYPHEQPPASEGAGDADETTVQPDGPEGEVVPMEEHRADAGRRSQATPETPPTGGAAAGGGRRRSERPSFITGTVEVEPARQGWRAAANRGGLRLGPGRGERAERADVATVSQHWPGPRTIAVANPKGSANKTPTTAMLAAIFARYGGAGVLAWDNNETRGSLAWRTQAGPHQATVLDLLPQADRLLATDAQSAQMNHWTHHQPEDKYDVLWSDQSVAGDHVVTSEDVERVWQVAARYYRLLLMDSGNSERAPNWRSMTESGDALVVPCTNVEDTPEAGALMLEALASRSDHARRLADNAVAVVSQRTPGKDANVDRIERDLQPLVREVVRIPYDPELTTGVIRLDALRPATRRAWLAAAAAVARSL